MKKSGIIIYAGVILLSLGVFTSCKSKKEASATAKTTTNETAPCRLRVEFYSIGTGSDANGIAKLKEYLDAKKLVYETKNWGREGEVNFCVKMDGLKEKDQIKHIDEVKKLLTSSQYVRFQENTTIK
jgi:hypothetical protein